MPELLVKVLEQVVQTILLVQLEQYGPQAEVEPFTYTKNPDFGTEHITLKGAMGS